jgi:SAM-dependent methyltransferase
VNCRICGNADDHRTYVVREMMFGTGEVFNYFQCPKCWCLQIAQIPADPARYYPSDSCRFAPAPLRSYKSRVTNFIKRPRYRFAVLNRGILGGLLYLLFPNRDLRKLSYAGLKEDSRILDVGCRAGELLYRLRNVGLTHLLGIDPTIDSDIQYENGLQVLRKFLHEMEPAWDLVMFHASLEHMSDQFAALADAHRLLDDAGTCLVRIPIVSSQAWEHYGVHWVQLNAPRHLYLHSVRSFTLVAEKAGFRVDRVLYDSTAFQFWGSEQVVRKIPLKSERSWLVDPSRSIFSRNEIRDFSRRAELLNRAARGDQAAFYLKKA